MNFLFHSVKNKVRSLLLITLLLGVGQGYGMEQQKKHNNDNDLGTEIIINPPLHAAILAKESIIERLHKIKKILKENPDAINQQNSQGETPIHLALLRSNVSIFQALLKYTPNLTITTKSGQNVFHFTIIIKDSKDRNSILLMLKDYGEAKKIDLKSLIDAPASNPKNKSTKNYPLHFLFGLMVKSQNFSNLYIDDYLKSLKLMLRLKPDIKVTNDSDHNILHYATNIQNPFLCLKVLEMLIEEFGAHNLKSLIDAPSSNQKNKLTKNYPLHLLLCLMVKSENFSNLDINDCLDTLKLILSLKPDLTLTNDSDHNILHHATTIQNPFLRLKVLDMLIKELGAHNLKSLIDAPAYNSKNKSTKNYPLHLLLGLIIKSENFSDLDINDCLDTFKLMLSLKPDPTVTNDSDYNILHYATSIQNPFLLLKVLDMLIKEFGAHNLKSLIDVPAFSPENKLIKKYPLQLLINFMAAMTKRDKFSDLDIDDCLDALKLMLSLKPDLSITNSNSFNVFKSTEFIKCTRLRNNVITMLKEFANTVTNDTEKIAIEHNDDNIDENQNDKPIEKESLNKESLNNEEINKRLQINYITSIDQNNYEESNLNLYKLSWACGFFSVFNGSYMLYSADYRDGKKSLTDINKFNSWLGARKNKIKHIKNSGNFREDHIKPLLESENNFYINNSSIIELSNIKAEIKKVDGEYVFIPILDDILEKIKTYRQANTNHLVILNDAYDEINFQGHWIAILLTSDKKVYVADSLNLGEKNDGAVTFIYDLFTKQKIASDDNKEVLRSKFYNATVTSNQTSILPELNQQNSSVVNTSEIIIVNNDIHANSIINSDNTHNNEVNAVTTGEEREEEEEQAFSSFNCPLCTQGFEDKCELYFHMKNQHKDDKCCCPYENCEAVLNNEELCTQHILFLHKNDQCPMRNCSINHSILAHSGTKISNKRTNPFDLLPKVPKKRKTDNFEALFNQKETEKHIDIHGGGFVCPYCENTSFKIQSRLDDHIHKNHELECIWCERCQPFPTPHVDEEAFFKHMRKEHEHSKSNYQSNDGVEKKRSSKKQDPLVLGGNLPYSIFADVSNGEIQSYHCPFSKCKEACSSLKRLKTHLATEHDTSIEDDVNPVIFKINHNTYTCPFCNALNHGVDKKILSNHLKTGHPLKKNFVCIHNDCHSVLGRLSTERFDQLSRDMRALTGLTGHNRHFHKKNLDESSEEENDDDNNNSSLILDKESSEEENDDNINEDE